MSELEEFYQRYIDAVNAHDSKAFAACYHLPVTLLAAPRPNERGVGLRPRALPDMDYALGTFPDHWARSSIDSLVELADVAPLVGDLTGEAAGADLGPRQGIIATCTRWDTSGKPYERVQALYLCTRQDGELGIKVIAEMATFPIGGS